jgi:hypothetical protein
MNHALLSSANAKYHFWAFDVLANFSLRGCDSRVILCKGFVEKQGSGGICFRGSKEPIFNSEHIENRAVVSKLCASIAERTPTYFYTHSGSMRTHFGLRLNWAWLMSDEIESLYCEEVTEAERSHWRRRFWNLWGLIFSEHGWNSVKFGFCTSQEVLHYAKSRKAFKCCVIRNYK